MVTICLLNTDKEALAQHGDGSALDNPPAA